MLFMTMLRSFSNSRSPYLGLIIYPKMVPAILGMVSVSAFLNLPSDLSPGFLYLPQLFYTALFSGPA